MKDIDAPAGPELHHRTLGVSDLVFFMLAASGPLLVVGGALAVGYVVSGNAGLPLLVLCVTAVLIVFTAGYAAMSRYVTNAGAFYAYISAGLGRIPGSAAAAVALIGYNAIQVGVYGLFGVAMAGFFGPKLGIDLAWWGWALIGWALVAVLGVLRVDLNARLLGVLLVVECIVVVTFDIAGLSEPGAAGITLRGLDPSVAFGAATGAAFCLVFLAFFGFEQAAIYSEEAKDPRRTVARATYISLLLLGSFYAVSSWALGVAAGPDVITSADGLVQAGYTTGGMPDPSVVFFAVGGAHLGSLWGDVALLLFCTSNFAALLAFHNAIARYFFAMGRARLLPAWFAAIGKRSGAPIGGSLAQSALAVVVFGSFALAGEDPLLTLFTWMPAMGALGMVFLLTCTGAATLAYFRRRPELPEGPYATRIAPAISTVALAVLCGLMVANFNVLITGATDAPTHTMAYVLPGLLLLAGVLGAVRAAVLRRTDPVAYAAIGTTREPVPARPAGERGEKTVPA